MANQDHLATLKKGVRAWNKWRASNSDITPDLRASDLSELDLSKINLSEASIQGVNFSKTILQGADFSHSKAGIKTNFEGLVLAQIPVLFSLFSAFLAISSSWFLASYFIPEIQVEGRIFGAFLFLSYLIFLLITGLKKFNSGIIFLVGTASMSLFFVLVKNGFLLAISFSPFFNSIQVAASVIAGGIFLILSFALGSYGNRFLWPYGFINIALFLRLFFDLSQESSLYERSFFEHNIEVYLQKFLIAFILSFSLAFIYRSITRRLLKENSEFSKLLRDAGKIFWTSRGTSFLEADLTDANFHSADLRSADLRGAILTRVCWKDAENLLGSEIIQNQKILIERVRTEGTILADPDIRELLIAGSNGIKDFRGKSLKGAYLVDVDLRECDFTEADLSEANLERANLKEANLTRVQAAGASFKEAQLTGVSGLGSWNVDSNTNLDDADCQYIYLKTFAQERRPSDISKNFEPGDLKRLFQRALETVDLIFKQEEGIDFAALSLSLEKLRVEAEGADITIQAIEKKPDGSFLVRVKVPLEANKAEVEKYLRREYDLQLKLKEEQLQDYQGQLKEQRQQNTELIGIIKVMADKETSKVQQNFYGQVHGVIGSNEGIQNVLQRPRIWQNQPCKFSSF
ncbi:MAG: hypothetical protein HC878_15550 [Leptolyngbyaceae cyanobacterium SL_5_14]|nr:hypothetical protein [Leptolyngbyaceae cyanobacterium SL_5_14]